VSAELDDGSTARHFASLLALPVTLKDFGKTHPFLKK
jgi:hypothetical protein